MEQRQRSRSKANRNDYTDHQYQYRVIYSRDTNMRAAPMFRTALGAAVLGLAAVGGGAAKQNVVRVQVLNKVRTHVHTY